LETAEAPGSGGTTTTTTTLGFSHEPDDVVVARGQSARLDCLVRLPPTLPPNVSSDRNYNNGTSQQQQQQQQQPQQHLDEPIAFDIHWFQDGMPIVLPDSRRHILANGSLYFDKVRENPNKFNRNQSNVMYKSIPSSEETISLGKCCCCCCCSKNG
jgi:hypothetical protein